MVVRNLLTMGSHVTPIPLSLHLTLQYDEDGRIEKVYTDYDLKEDATKDLLVPMLQHSMIPSSITIKNGTTYVYGIMKPNKLSTDMYLQEGILPDCILPKMLELFKEDMTQFHFEACDAKSYAASFNGYIAVSNFLTVSKFKLAPGFIVPASMDDQLYDKLVTGCINNKYDVVELYVHDKSFSGIKSLKLSQICISKLTPSMEMTGQFVELATNASTDTTLRFDLSEAIRYNLHQGDHIWVDEENEVVRNTGINKWNVQPRSLHVTCPVCGKQFDIDTRTTQTFCKDEKCISRQYPNVNRFLTTLHLPTITKERYDEVTKEIGKIFSIPDILDISEFREVTVDATIRELFVAIIPPRYLGKADIDALTYLIRKCNNTVSSIEYYLNHIEQVEDDLEIKLTPHIVTWLSVPSNVLDLVSLFHMKQIHVVENDYMFDGAPIFRNKLICITGDFLHGSHEVITRILKSYAATVTETYQEGVSCVVVGDTCENVNGQYIKKAKKDNIPIFEECRFFAKYEIDDDLRENL